MPGSPAFEVTNATGVSGNARPSMWLLDALNYPGRSDAGVTVNGYTALQHAPIWQGINVIAGDIGQIPVRLVKDEFDDQKNHPAWSLLRGRPNELQTPSVWKETMMQWALLWGNGVSWILRRGSRPAELIPLRPDCLWYELLGFEGNQYVIYHYNSPTSGREYTFLQDEVVHIQGLTSDGIWGYPLWEIAKNTIGHGLALEKHGNRQFKGVHPGGILKLDNTNYGNKEARDSLRADIERMHAGPDNAGRMMILRDVWDFQANQPMNNTDAEWVSARKLDRQMAASLLNLPGWKLNATEDSSVRANLEETNADYIQRTLNRWFTRLSEELSRKLLTTAQFNSGDYEFKWDVSEVLKADIDTLSTVVDRLVKATIINPNEGRRMLGLPPYSGGELYGSPAINPRKDTPASGGETAEAAEPKAPAATNQAHRALLMDRVTHLIEREQRIAGKQATDARNFVSWLDSFYGGELRYLQDTKFAAMTGEIIYPAVEACREFGLHSSQRLIMALDRYAKERHETLLESAGAATKEELPRLVDLINSRPPELVASDILTEALDSGS